MQTIRYSRSVFTLIEKNSDVDAEEGHYFPLHTLDSQLFLTERDIGMDMVL